MRYEIRLIGRLGPLMSSALEDVRVTSVPPHTVVTISGTPDGLTHLLSELEELGIEVDRLRVVAAREGRHSNGRTSRRATATEEPPSR